MSNLKKIKTALLNRAFVNPYDFEILLKHGMNALVTHKETRLSTSINPNNGIIIMGSSLYSWAFNNDIKQYGVYDKEYLELWIKLKKNSEI
jgi:hypothetical protein